VDERTWLHATRLPVQEVPADLFIRFGALSGLGLRRTNLESLASGSDDYFGDDRLGLLLMDKSR